MTETQNEFILSGNEYFLTQKEQEYYRLEKGHIQVYVVPTLEGGICAEPKLLCEIRDTDRQRAIAPLVYESEDHRQWRLLLKTDGQEAVLCVFPREATSVLRNNFLKKANISASGDLSFAERLVHFFYGQEQIILSSTDQLITENACDAYRVEKGKIFLYITPIREGKPGLPEFYCEISDADAQPVFPALDHVDRNHQRWRLMIKTAGEDAVLEKLPNAVTHELEESFLLRKNIQTLEKEGFQNSLIEYYTDRITLRDHAFISRSKEADKKSSQKVVGVLKNTFSTDAQSELSGNANYQALSYLCGKMNISLLKPEELTLRCGKDPKITDIANASHFICRKVVLEPDWFKRDCGGLIGTLDKEVVACVPEKNGQYRVFRTSNASVTRLTPELAQQISPQAFSIGRTLPLKSLSKKDVLAFCRKSIRPRDLMPYILLVLFCSLIGVLIPTLNGMIYDDYIPIGNISNLVQLCLVMLSFMVGNVAFSVVKNLFGYRTTSRLGNELQNAVYYRLFHLPESFFRDYDSADLAGRIISIGATASQYANTLVLSSISALFAVFYLIRMLSYSGKLTWIGVALYLVYLVLSTVITAASHKGQTRVVEQDSECRGRLFQYLNGVDKIRMAGVEEQALLSYMQPFSKQQQEMIRVNRLVSVQEALATVIKSVFSMVLYWVIVKKLSSGTLSIGSFVAFNSAFGSFTGALDSFVNELLDLMQKRSELKRFFPVFSAVPEDDDSKQMPGELSGDLSLEHVSFSYGKGGKNVLNDLSVHIRPGEYVGIVGPSGCGKSTLLKLLLGFETPQSGAIMIDKQDLAALNKGAYRRQLGVVLQNGKLISGSIYDNITITAPDTNLARVNEVVEQVGLKDDIAQMPMGLHTMLSESSNTISGGQQQRILIARAICGKPKILIFDEATSALDNVTQATVSSSLDKMNVTRIVVAHRLSTIKNCDRILVLQGGEIIQEGDYDTLMQDKNGLFYALASRQIAQ